jgi:branched-chain amino acid transport system substrate-binding protein
VKSQKPDAKVAVLYQNDDFGKELLNAFKHAIEGSGVKVIAAQSYEVSSPTVDSQMSNLAASGADVFFAFGVPKFTAQSLRDIQASSWRPMTIIANISASKKATMDPAGAEASEGVYSGMMQMDPTSPQYAKTHDIEVYREIGKKYGSAGLNLDDPITMLGYGQAQTMVETLKHAKAPTREAIMESVRHLCNVEILGMIPGVKVCTNGDKDPFFLESMQMVRYTKGIWEPVGKVITEYEGKTPLEKH